MLRTGVHSITKWIMPTTATAWRAMRSWALVDKAIDPTQRTFMAKRAGATIIEIHSSHVAIISHLDAVTKPIQSAANATDEPPGLRSGARTTIEEERS